MSAEVIPEQAKPYLRPFEPLFAPVVAQWVGSDEQLRMLAPSTEPPLTAAKVVAWRRDGGRAFLLVADQENTPIGYGELNALPKEKSHLWIGHVIIRPEERGRGLGTVLVRALLSHAFERLSAKRVSLIVFPENEPAIRCYHRAGLTLLGDESHQFGGSGPRYTLLRFEARAPSRQRKETA